ncbi:MAG: EamA family transporter [Chloroflexi bacterium]|nr:EamA family transporter [Chloroflexota bacterium]MCI0847550.1 EamA family transporter [Chloroflexota bacterium]MCI0900816.1 EamA family transporter [Chloroflexota bacterium]
MPLRQISGAILRPMTALSLVLVLLSAVAHASWNLMLKRATDPEVFAWCLLVVATVLLAPLGVALFLFNSVGLPGLWFVLATIVLHVLYFNLLARGYAQGDLSLVYPVARGMGPMLVPVLAVVLLNETIEPLAIAGIAAIIGGIYTISWWGNFHQVLRSPLLFLRSTGMRYAVLTGLTIAAYSIVDKEGVGHIQPLLYMYFLSFGTAVMLAPYILFHKGAAAVRTEWRANAVPITVAGLLTFTAYGLVLTAFSLSRVSYVAPAREVGIVIGVLMGVFLLKEPFGGGRLLGSGFIVGGLALVALSP